MEWLFGIVLATGIVYLYLRADDKPCPRESKGYRCRKESGRKCECEELSYCCGAPITETRICTDCKDNC